MKETQVINLFAGPGAGKSTLAAAVFAQLKWNDINTELATEYAKDIVWGECHKVLDNQIYVFGKQLHRIHRLLGKVDIIVTDAPLMNSVLYYDGIYKDSLGALIIDVVNSMNNINFFIERKKRYNPAGRIQTEGEATKLDIRVQEMLKAHNMPYIPVPGIPESANKITDLVLKMREQNERHT